MDVTVLRITELWIGFDIAVDSILSLDALNPVSLGVPVEVATLEGDNRSGMASETCSSSSPRNDCALQYNGAFLFCVYHTPVADGVSI